MWPSVVEDDNITVVIAITPTHCRLRQWTRRFATSSRLVSELLVNNLEYSEDYYTAEDNGNIEFPCITATAKPVNQLYRNPHSSDSGLYSLKAPGSI